MKHTEIIPPDDPRSVHEIASPFKAAGFFVSIAYDHRRNVGVLTAIPKGMQS